MLDLLRVRVLLRFAVCLLVVASGASDLGIARAAPDPVPALDLPAQDPALSEADILRAIGVGVGGASGCRPDCPVRDPSATTMVLQDPVVLGQPVRLQACDFAQGERVRVVITAPGGARVADYNRSLASEYDPSARCVSALVPPTTFSAFGEFGVHQLKLVGSTRTENLSFTLKPPSSPVVLSRGDHFELAGFAPREPTRLIGFGSGGRALVGEWRIAVRDDGTQLVRGTNADVLYAIGTRSGDANSAYDANDPRSRIWVKHGNGRDRGSIVDVARAASLYTVPNAAGGVVTSVRPGTRLRLDSHALSNAGLIWWQAMLGDGRQGWVRDDVLRASDFTKNRSSDVAAPLFLADRLARGPARYTTPESWTGGFMYNYTATFLSIPSGGEEWFTMPLNVGETVTILAERDGASATCGMLRLALVSPDGRLVGKEDSALRRAEVTQSGVFSLRVALRSAAKPCVATYHLAVDISPSVRVGIGTQSGDADNWTFPWGGQGETTYPFVFTTAGPASSTPEASMTWRLPTSAVPGVSRSTDWTLSAFIPRHPRLNSVAQRGASSAAYQWREVGGAWQPLATIDQEMFGDEFVELGTVTNVERDIEVRLADNAQSDDQSTWVLFSMITATARDSVTTLN